MAVVRRFSRSASDTFPPEPEKLLEVTEVQLPDLLDLGGFTVHLVEAREVLGGLEDDRARARVVQDVLDLRGRRRLVDRHDDRTGVGGREVDQRPLVAHLAHEADLLARLDTGGDEALCEGDDLAMELGGADVVPASVGGRDGEQRVVRGLRNAVLEKVRDVRLGIRFDDNRGVSLFHGHSFGAGYGSAQLS